MGSESAGRGWVRAVWWLVLVALYVLLATLGRELGVFGPLSVWYPPAGLALALGFLWGWPALPLVAVAEFTSGIVVFGIDETFTPAQMLINALGYAAVYVGSAGALRQAGLRPRVDAVGDGVTMLVVGGALAPMIAAVFGVGMQVWAGMVDASTFGRSAWIWWLGDSIGALTLMPAVLVGALALGADGRRRVPAALARSHPAVTALTLVAPTAAAGVLVPVAGDSVGMLFLVFLPMAVAATRHGVAGTALATLVLSPAVTLLANTHAATLGLERTDVQLLLLGLMAAAYLIGLSADERTTLYERLQRREAHLAEAQTLSGIGSFRYDVAADVSVWSRGLYELYGRDPDSGPVDFATYLSGIHPDDRDRVREVVTGLLAAPSSVRYEYRLVRDDDHTERWVEARIESTVDHRGTVDTIVGTCQDITARRTAEEATRGAMERERAAADGIAQAERVKDALLVAVSHEVRTPLTVVYGIADTLARPEVRQDAAMVGRLATRLDQHVGRLRSMLDDLLDTGRLARGAVRARREATSLVDLVARRLAEPDLEDRELDVDVTDTPTMVDRALVSRILDHLVTNALRYTDPDVPLWVRTEERGDDLLLVVEDAGPGVASDRAEAIFEPFHQDRILDHAPGTGLGLYLVARFAELHGGRAWVEPRSGGGASFHVLLGDALAPPSPRSVASDGYRMAPGA